MIKVNSYKDVNGLTFNSVESDALEIFGEPVRQCFNREKEKEFYYRNFILRFDSKTGGFREFTLLPELVGTINEVPIDWDGGFLDWLGSKDSDLKEVLGFVLSLNLGIAVAGFEDGERTQLSIHAFRIGDWDLFKNRMRPFKQPIGK